MNEIKSDFFSIAEQSGHEIIYFPLPETKSVSVPNGQTGCIGLDPSLYGKELRTRLAHELGHCEYGGFYTRLSPLDTVGRHEYRANKWAVERAIPFDELETAIKRGYTDLCDLSDYFDVTEEMVQFALTYYFDRRGYRLSSSS
ncbi:MAG: ImmA/IrrE family metallo-endopeptidase [Clostridiaceae bacterium]|nr:ImmA/IrrE family metallo-endopeptidase [Clostridiaceae bacterium]